MLYRSSLLNKNAPPISGQCFHRPVGSRPPSAFFAVSRPSSQCVPARRRRPAIYPHWAASPTTRSDGHVRFSHDLFVLFCILFSPSCFSFLFFLSSALSVSNDMGSLAHRTLQQLSTHLPGHAQAHGARTITAPSLARCPLGTGPRRQQCPCLPSPSSHRRICVAPDSVNHSMTSSSGDLSSLLTPTPLRRNTVRRRLISAARPPVVVKRFIFISTRSRYLVSLYYARTDSIPHSLVSLFTRTTSYPHNVALLFHPASHKIERYRTQTERIRAPSPLMEKQIDSKMQRKCEPERSLQLRPPARTCACRLQCGSETRR